MNFKLLEENGINVKSGINRFGNKEKLYEKYLLKFLNDNSFNELYEFMMHTDYEKAFMSAHTLKGIVGNLSLDNLYEPLCDLVEGLRKGNNLENAIKLLPIVKEKYDICVNAIIEANK